MCVSLLEPEMEPHEADWKGASSLLISCVFLHVCCNRLSNHPGDVGVKSEVKESGS
jgi:hypothetical protein